MNKMKFLTISVVVLFLLNISTLFILYRMHSTAPGHTHRPPGEDPTRYIVEQLQLDNRQQQQFADLRRQHQAFAEQATAEDRRLHDLYFRMLKSNDTDRAKVDSVATLIGRQRKQMALATFHHFQQLRAICNEDQKKRYDATIDKIVRMVVGPPPPGGPPH